LEVLGLDDNQIGGNIDAFNLTQNTLALVLFNDGLELLGIINA